MILSVPSFMAARSALDVAAGGVAERGAGSPRAHVPLDGEHLGSSGSSSTRVGLNDDTLEHHNDPSVRSVAT